MQTIHWHHITQCEIYISCLHLQDNASTYCEFGGLDKYCVDILFDKKKGGQTTLVIFTQDNTQVEIPNQPCDDMQKEKIQIGEEDRGKKHVTTYQKAFLNVSNLTNVHSPRMMKLCTVFHNTSQSKNSGARSSTQKIDIFHNTFHPEENIPSFSDTTPNVKQPMGITINSRVVIAKYIVIPFCGYPEELCHVALASGSSSVIKDSSHYASTSI